MSDPVRAFICYRREDAFSHKPSVGEGDASFVRNVRSALTKIGFTDVFLDVDHKYGTRALDQYESRSFHEIEICDLFVVLIGKNWLDLLRERVDRRDAPVREIRAALRYGKQILPLLVDGATMPRQDQLPKDIRELHYQNALPISSEDPIDTIASVLAEPGTVIEHARSVGDEWRKIYITLSLAVYFFCAIPPHVLGIRDYGWNSWFGMARIWGGLFIWPALFLPFVLVAAYRPLTTLIQFSASSPDLKKGAIYASPLIFGTLLTMAVWFAEVYDPREVPWTIQPELPQDGCRRGPPPPSRDLNLSPQDRAQWKVFIDLSSYDGDDHLKTRYQARDVPYWLVDKCWPNVLFYLTVPIYTGMADDLYISERRVTQDSFRKMLDNQTRRRFGVGNSWTAWAYRISFAILAWLGLVGVMMSVYFIALKLRDPKNYSIQDLPREDAIICLTYSVATLMTWIPFRMVTEYYKFLYSCELIGACAPEIDLYMPDMIFGSVLIVGYLLLTAGLLAEYRRILLTIVGFTMALASLLAAYAVYNYKEVFARLAERWQFYIVLAVPSIVLLVLLWNLFNPAELRKNEFARDIDEN
jgi:hypothetical protein